MFRRSRASLYLSNALNGVPAEVTIQTRTQQKTNWQRHFFYRKESIKTTWKLRLAILILVILTVSATQGFWVSRIGQSLVSTEEIRQSDIILVENYDNPDFQLFERAAELRRAGVASRILIPAQASRDAEDADTVSKGIAELT